MNLRELKIFINESTDAIVQVYDDVERFLFQDVDSCLLFDLCPQWIAQAGISPESGIRKSEYEKLLSTCKSQISHRLLHWYDVELLLSSLQDRISSINYFVDEFYLNLGRVSPIPSFNNARIASKTIFTLSEITSNVYVSANAIFISIASALDIISKISFEVSRYSLLNAGSYKKLLSKDILYKPNLSVVEELTGENTIFCDAPEIRLVEAIRNEYVHNGSWSYRVAVYQKYDDEGNLIDTFLPFPDIENGSFVSSGSRRNFYSNDVRLNDILPDIITPAIKRIVNTANAISLYCRSKTRKYDAETIKRNTEREMICLRQDWSQYLEILKR